MENNKRQYPTSLFVMCLLLPIIGFIGSLMYIDSNEKLGKTLLNMSWIGFIFEIIVAVIIIATKM